HGLDWALYRHARRRFWAQAKAFGLPRLRREVSELRRRRRGLARLCLQGGGPVPGGDVPERSLRPFQPPGAATVMGFALRPGLGPEERERCERMAMPELQYKDLLERRQFGGPGGDP
ncbi:G3ST4 sulfotransferase, partial [Campylorhamphus procurvoides]|nr:G3ST4 sulfotransferase [Campylorhamphus procurvoides]